MVTTTITSTSASVHQPTNSPIDTAALKFGNTLLIPLLASIIGDVVIAVILTISIMIICVIIRFKKGRNGQPNTLSSTMTATARPQAKNQGTQYACSLIPRFPISACNIENLGIEPGNEANMHAYLQFCSRLHLL